MTDKPSTPDTVSVLIVGAGPTGLTLACEVARRGVAYRVIEAAPGPQPGSRGKGLQPRSLEVFDDLGIVDRVLANGRMGMPMRVTDPAGRTALRGGGIPEARPDVPYPASVITPQWRIEEALRLRLAELGGAVEFGCAFTGFAPSDAGVTARITSGGQAGTVSADWLVGCDGGRGTVRGQAAIAFVGETREEVRMIVADVAVAGLDREAWQMWSHEDGLVSLCPLPSTDGFQFQAGISPGQDPEPSLANMQAILERRSGRRDIRLREPTWSSLWRANVRLAERYRAGRVLIAGDAAHVHSPAGGQGMNTGIQDAHNLGWKLAAVVRGAAPDLLDSYEAERRPVAAGVLALSNERLREAIEQKALPARRDAGTTQLDISYRGSALARDDRGATASLRAGDRAPDATMLATASGSCRLFDLTRGGRFILLDFRPLAGRDDAPPALDLPSDVAVVRVTRAPGRAGEVADAGGHLASAFEATERTLVLIRPDGYVGLISDAGDVSSASDYLAAVGWSIGQKSVPHFSARSDALPGC